jgi:hypothetical protein
MPPKAKKAKTSNDNTSASKKEARATSAQGGNKRRIVELAQDADAVLSKCRQLREELKRKHHEKDLQKTSSNSLSTGFHNQEEDEEDVIEVPLKIEQNDTDIAAVSNNDNNMIESLQGKSIIEVSEMSSMEVVEAIESVAVQIANQVLLKKGFTLEIPSRSASNQIYVPELDRIVLGEKRGTRSFLNVKVSSIANDR